MRSGRLGADACSAAAAAAAAATPDEPGQPQRRFHIVLSSFARATAAAAATLEDLVYPTE